jgi:hypothetical protein
MAARTRKGTKATGWPVEVRQRIRTSMLLNRLTAHALGEPDPQTGKPVDLSATQVRAIEILLRKSLPDLSATAIAETKEGPAGSEPVSETQAWIARVLAERAAREGVHER